MKSHPHVRSFGRQYYSKQLLVKLSIVAALVMVLLAATLSMNVSKTQAHTNSTQISTGQLSSRRAAMPNDITGMIYQVFGPVYGPQAVRIARCESSLNPQAYNPMPIGGSHAMGLFQILYPSTWAGAGQAGSHPYNAMANIQAAHNIFVRDGYSWREWECRP